MHPSSPPEPPAAVTRTKRRRTYWDIAGGLILLWIVYAALDIWAEFPEPPRSLGPLFVLIEFILIVAGVLAGLERPADSSEALADLVIPLGNLAAQVEEMRMQIATLERHEGQQTRVMRAAVDRIVAQDRKFEDRMSAVDVVLAELGKMVAALSNPDVVDIDVVRSLKLIDQRVRGGQRDEGEGSEH